MQHICVHYVLNSTSLVVFTLIKQKGVNVPHAYTFFCSFTTSFFSSGLSVIFWFHCHYACHITHCHCVCYLTHCHYMWYNLLILHLLNSLSVPLVCKSLPRHSLRKLLSLHQLNTLSVHLLVNSVITPAT